MKRIGILTAVWKRPYVTDFCLGYMSTLKVPGVEFERLAVVSEDVSLPPGWNSVYYDNLPLGAKWNAGMREMGNRDVDGVVIMGSDDICTQSLLEHYADTNPYFATVSELYVYDTVSQDTIRLYRGTMGAGRYVRRDAMESCSWVPWDDDIDKGLDRSVERSLKCKPEALKHHVGKVLDVKSKTNIWAFDFLRDNTRNEPADTDESLALFGLTRAAMPRD